MALLSNVSIFALQGFMADCPDGRMDRERMKVMFKALMPEGDAGDVFLDQFSGYLIKMEMAALTLRWAGRCSKQCSQENQK